MKYGITLGYTSKLNELETIEGIEFVTNELESRLKLDFDLIKVRSGLVTDKTLWLNDDFQQTKRPIDFDVSSEKMYGELLQSNNKWRRYFLMNNGLVENNQGIITNFSTVTRDTVIDNMNSVVYDELGFEIVKHDYSIEEINSVLIKVYKALVEIDLGCSSKYNSLGKNHLGEKLTFISHKKLKALYPLLTFKERLSKFGKDNGSFVLQNYVEKTLNQQKNTQFSEDVYDFNSYSKLYVYNKSCEKVTSMGYVSYQVDRETLKSQSTILKENNKTQTFYHHLIKSNKLPLTITGGIFINRYIMTLLEKQHIGEVQSSLWNKKFLQYCEINNIKIL